MTVEDFGTKPVLISNWKPGTAARKLTGCQGLSYFRYGIVSFIAYSVYLFTLKVATYETQVTTQCEPGTAQSWRRH